MKAFKTVGLIVFLLVLLAFPQVFSNPTVTTVAFFTLLYATATTGWNIFSGYTGYIALGHAVYYGIGSYAMALLCNALAIPGGYLPFLLLPLVGLIAATAALPLGWISLRTRKHTFVVITIAIFFIFQLLAFNLRSITNGSSGLSLPIPATWSGDFFNKPYYYAAMVIFLVALGVSWWVRNSKYGLGLLAIRDDEDRALGLGIKTGRYKLSAFVVSAFFVGMVGALHAYYIESIFPAFAFDQLFDVALALMTFLGGLGTLVGPVLGAFILEPTQQYFTIQFGQNGTYQIIYGVLFLAIILLLPEGIVPTLRKVWLKRKSARDDARRGATPVEQVGGESALAGGPSRKDGVKL
jgi:branched-chain amino acid transport system permease protein